jgi:hypothetical protein
MVTSDVEIPVGVGTTAGGLTPSATAARVTQTATPAVGWLQLVNMSSSAPSAAQIQSGNAAKAAIAPDYSAQAMQAQASGPGTPTPSAAVAWQKWQPTTVGQDNYNPEIVNGTNHTADKIVYVKCTPGVAFSFKISAAHTYYADVPVAEAHGFWDTIGAAGYDIGSDTSVGVHVSLDGGSHFGASGESTSSHDSSIHWTDVELPHDYMAQYLALPMKFVEYTRSDSCALDSQGNRVWVVTEVMVDNHGYYAESPLGAGPDWVGDISAEDGLAGYTAAPHKAKYNYSEPDGVGYCGGSTGEIGGDLGANLGPVGINVTGSTSRSATTCEIFHQEHNSATIPGYPEHDVFSWHSLSTPMKGTWQIFSY